MQRKVVTIGAGDCLSTVEDIMTLGGVRHMPVMRSGRLVGVVSERDLLRASLSNLPDFGRSERRAFLREVRIDQVMTSPAITVDPVSSVKNAARLMADHKIGCLPVVEDEALVGLITETDVLRYFAHSPEVREVRE